MNCKQFGIYLDEYENLCAMQKAELIAHTNECENCRKEYELFISMLNATKSIPPLKVDDSFLENLNARIDKEVVNAPVRINVWEHMKLNAHRYSAIAACVALLAVIGVNNADLLNSMMNPYQDQDIVPIVSTSPEFEQNNTSAGIIITSTIAPTQSPAPSVEPTTTPATVQIVTPATSDVVNSRATVAPAPTKEPISQQAPVATIAPAQPTATETITPSPASDEQNYVMPASTYELPNKDTKNPQNNNFSSAYDFENTPNYVKLSQMDIERVKGLIAEYSKENKGDVYLMTEEDAREFFAILSNEGIKFDSSLSGIVNGNIAFKLIIS